MISNKLYLCVGCSKYMDENENFTEIITGESASFYLCKDCEDKKTKSLNTSEVVN